jgi:16S rRNA (uracil1498-N3)-methyltransferase
MHRFFLSASELLSNTPVLSGDEGHHCIQVLRHQVGDKVVLFDGMGHDATAVIEAIAKASANLKVVLRSKSQPVRCRITLGQAIPKGKNMDLIVQKAVELGAHAIVPLLSERTVVQLSADDLEDKRQKWQAVALEACKQCGQNYLPVVHSPVSPKTFFEQVAPPGLRLVASLQSDALPIKTVLREATENAGNVPSEVTVLVGPEGDFTPAELSLSRSHGCRPVTLGPIILRTETAAIYCLSVLGHELFSTDSI